MGCGSSAAQRVHEGRSNVRRSRRGSQTSTFDDCIFEHPPPETPPFPASLPPMVESRFGIAVGRRRALRFPDISLDSQEPMTRTLSRSDKTVPVGSNPLGPSSAEANPLFTPQAEPSPPPCLSTSTVGGDQGSPPVSPHGQVQLEFSETTASPVVESPHIVKTSRQVNFGTSDRNTTDDTGCPEVLESVAADVSNLNVSLSFTPSSVASSSVISNGSNWYRDYPWTHHRPHPPATPSKSRSPPSPPSGSPTRVS
eukprot:Hpha_TRINITY_DN14817_c0_g2::TRINITY_DN14817_c0_g2_i1::g.170386::m.170386